MLKTKALNTLKFTLCIIYLVGVIGLSLPSTFHVFKNLTPLPILLTIGVLAYYHKPYTKKHVGVFVVIIIFSWGIEAIGVNTGRIFGSYSYGPSLGFKVFETPVLIGLNWLLLIYCTHAVVSKFNLHFLNSVVCSALLMTFIDFLMEPVAIKLDMWHWTNADIPLQNYMAWFIIAMLFHLFLKITGLNIKNKMAGFIFMLFIAFFAVQHIIIRLN